MLSPPPIRTTGGLTPQYEQRHCDQNVKLGLQGIAFVYSSGDFGVAGKRGHVLSIGATQLLNGTSIRGAESACQKVIFSGGGFSNVFPMPWCQKTAVSNYFGDFPPQCEADRFNNSQTVRGYPNVSANGANYVTAVDGNCSLPFGTSGRHKWRALEGPAFWSDVL